MQTRVENTGARAKAKLSNYWMPNDTSGWVARRLLEIQPQVWKELATTGLKCLDSTYDNIKLCRDELWNGVQVRASGRGFSLNKILDRICGDDDFTCLNGRWATHPEISYYIGKKRRKTVDFGSLYSFLVERVEETPQTARDIMWLISMAVFVSNLRGRLVKMLERIGVLEP